MVPVGAQWEHKRWQNIIAEVCGLLPHRTCPFSEQVSCSNNQRTPSKGKQTLVATQVYDSLYKQPSQNTGWLQPPDGHRAHRPNGGIQS